MQPLALEAGVEIRFHLLQGKRIAMQMNARLQGQGPITGLQIQRQPVLIPPIDQGGFQLGGRQWRHTRPLHGQTGIADHQQLLAVKQGENTLQRRPLLRVIAAQRLQATQTDTAILAAHQMQLHPMNAQLLEHQIPVQQRTEHVDAQHHLVQLQRGVAFRGRQANLTGHKLGHQAGHLAVQLGDGQRCLDTFFKEHFQPFAIIRYQQHQLAADHHIGRHQQQQGHRQPPEGRIKSMPAIGSGRGHSQLVCQ